MKLARLVTICFLAVSLALFSGCFSKTYFFDFTTEPDLSRSDGTWIPGSTDFSLDEEDGLILKNISAAAPHFYNGDFDVTWEFELGDTDEYRRSVYFYLSTGTDFPPPPTTEWFGGLAIADAQYSVGDYHFVYICNGLTTGITLSQPVDEVINSPGTNKIVISKKGDSLKFYLNDLEIGSGLSTTGYYKDWLNPQVLSFYQPGASWNLIVYKNFEVKYKGDQIPVE